MRSTSQIVDRYAQALFELASEHNALFHIYGQTQALAAALQEDATPLQILNDPTLPRDLKLRAIATLGQQKHFHSLLTQTLQTMVRKNRIGMAEGMLTRFNELYAAHDGQQIAEVTTAQPLTDAQKNQIKDTLRQIIGKPAQLVEKVDERLLGGVRIRLGSWLIDDSIAARLRRLEQQLLKAA